MSFDANNRITGTGYTHDAAGNLIDDGTGVGTHTYQWDAEGRMRSVDGDAGSLCQTGATNCMTYNAFGQEVEEKGSGFDWVYVYGASGEKIAWWDGVANGWQRYLTYAAGQEIRLYDSDLRYYYHRNHIGSGTMMTDQTGAPIGERLYYPWGDRWAAGGAWVTPQFASMLDTVSETADIYVTQFRHYLPGTFRWMSPDPLAGEITNPQSLNRYAYVFNNPINIIDPLGLEGICGPGRDTCEPWTRHTNISPGAHLSCPGCFMPWHIPGYTDLELQTMFGLVRLGPTALCEAGYATCEQYGAGVVGFDTAGNAWYQWENADRNLSRADQRTLEEMGWRTSDPILLGVAAIAVADTPAPGPADAVAAAVLATYVAYSNKDCIKKVMEQMPVLLDHIGKLENAPDQDPNREGWRRSIRAAIKRGRVWTNRMSPGMWKDAMNALLDQVEWAIPL